MKKVSADSNGCPPIPAIPGLWVSILGVPRVEIPYRYRAPVGMLGSPLALTQPLGLQ
jgi:hypothetical protein